MTSFFNNIINQYRIAIQQFMNYGYLNYYKFLYGSPQFPYWFVFQSFFSCYVAHKNIEGMRKTPVLLVRQLIISFLMTFSSREIFAYLFHKLSPIKHNPQSIIIFLGVFGIMCISPIFKIINFFGKLLGMTQGVNVARFFTLALRNIKGIPVQIILPVSIIFSVMDQLIELVFRTIFKGKEAGISNKNTILRSGIFCTIYWLFTHKNILTQYIGLYPIYFPALILAFALSLSNSSYSMLKQETYEQQQQPSERNEMGGDVIEENRQLKRMYIQLQQKSQEEHDKLTEEIEKLKKQLDEVNQKAKEDYDKLIAEIQHLKKD